MLEALAIVTTLVVGQPTPAAAPARPAQPPAVIVLDHLEDLYLPVRFDHRGHADMAALHPTGCVECHHYSPDATPYPACRSCHAADSAHEAMRMPGLKGAYHRQCLSCHSEWSHSTACSMCHRPKSGTAEADAVVGTLASHPPLQAPASLVFRTSLEAPVVTFHHADHAGGFGLCCADCHRGESCAHCHDQGRGAMQRVRAGLRDRCVDCHDSQAREDCRFCHKQAAQPDSFDHDVAVGWSLEPHHADLSCAGCHGSHDAFVTPSPSCAACHGQRGAGGGFDHRRANIDAGCGGCHDDVESAAAAAAHRHPPLERGCAACHDPAASDQPFFLRDAVSTVCFTCHEGVRTCLEQATLVHGPTGDRHGCATCHMPHGSTNPRLLRRPREELCLDCHDRNLEASDGRRLTNVAARLRACPNRHGPVRGDDCTACHQPHAAANDRLLRASYPASFYAPLTENAYELCFDCHDERLASAGPPIDHTGFRDGATNLHWMHLKGEKGRTCRVCHDPHASDTPFLIRTSVPFEDGSWEFSMGYVQTLSGGRCSPACHATKEYRRGELIARVDG